MDGGESLSDFEAHFAGEDIFSILKSLEGDETSNIPPVDELLASQKPITTCSSDHLAELEEAVAPKRKRQKLSSTEEANLQREDQHVQQRMAHISVERNRRKQMNQHLSLLRSLIPAFYVQRGDQASIIGGVAAYITELQEVLQSLEAKKQRKLAYRKLVLSPRLNNIVSNNYSPVLSPRKPPLSPRVLSLPISPRTPQPTSPYKTRLQQGYHLSSPLPSPSPSSSSSSSSSSTSSINDSANELAANSKSAIAVVEVKFSGPNVLLKTVSPRIPGQAAKIIAALEGLSLEILHVSISTIDETTLNSFTIKIGVECQLSAEELAQQIQRTFC